MGGAASSRTAGAYDRSRLVQDVAHLFKQANLSHLAASILS
jgi:hypothetical protein